MQLAISITPIGELLLKLFCHLGKVLSIYLYSIAYSIANSVGYFIHSALGDVLTKLTKASRNFFPFLGFLSEGRAQRNVRISPWTLYGTCLLSAVLTCIEGRGIVQATIPV